MPAHHSGCPSLRCVRIVAYGPATASSLSVPSSTSDTNGMPASSMADHALHFGNCIRTEIFSGGWSPAVPIVKEHAAKARLVGQRVKPLGPQRD